MVLIMYSLYSKQYSPFIFSSLEPYYNTYTVEYILDYVSSLIMRCQDNQYLG